MSKVDMVVLNDEEARLLTGEQNLVRAAKVVRSLGPKQLIIKRGEYGALLFDAAGSFFVPGYPLETVLDPTGAGDSFAGGLLGTIAREGEIGEYTLRRAMFFASSLASFCVPKKWGPNASWKPTRPSSTRGYARSRSSWTTGLRSILERYVGAA